MVLGGGDFPVHRNEHVFTTSFSTVGHSLWRITCGDLSPNTHTHLSSSSRSLLKIEVDSYLPRFLCWSSNNCRQRTGRKWRLRINAIFCLDFHYAWWLVAQTPFLPQKFDFTNIYLTAHIRATLITPSPRVGPHRMYLEFYCWVKSPVKWIRGTLEELLSPV